MLNNKLSRIDVCFLIASSAKKSYQKLSEIYSAIEPPTWALLLAQSCRSIGFKVNIVDANVENLSHQEILTRINELNQYKQKKIIVYCRSGNRSGRGTDLLIRHGFDAVNLTGGMNQWAGPVAIKK